MNDKLKQCILEMLRMGADPDELQESLRQAVNHMATVKTYKPNHDLADFYRAYKDADFRP